MPVQMIDSSVCTPSTPVLESQYPHLFALLDVWHAFLLSTDTAVALYHSIQVTLSHQLHQLGIDTGRELPPTLEEVRYAVEDFPVLNLVQAEQSQALDLPWGVGSKVRSTDAKVINIAERLARATDSFWYVGNFNQEAFMLLFLHTLSYEHCFSLSVLFFSTVTDHELFEKAALSFERQFWGFEMYVEWPMDKKGDLVWISKLWGQQITPNDNGTETEIGWAILNNKAVEYFQSIKDLLKAPPTRDVQLPSLLSLELERDDATGPDTFRSRVHDCISNAPLRVYSRRPDPSTHVNSATQFYKVGIAGTEKGYYVKEGERGEWQWVPPERPPV